MFNMLINVFHFKIGQQYRHVTRKQENILTFNWLFYPLATPIGKLPVLKCDDFELPQSLSIARFLAREVNLAGKNSIEQAKADAIVDTVIELLEPLVKILWIKDAKTKVDIVNR